MFSTLSISCHAIQCRGEGRCEHYEDGLEDLDFVYVGEDFQDDIFPIGWATVVRTYDTRVEVAVARP